MNVTNGSYFCLLLLADSVSIVCPCLQQHSAPPGPLWWMSFSSSSPCDKTSVNSSGLAVPVRRRLKSCKVQEGIALDDMNE